MRAEDEANKFGGKLRSADVASALARAVLILATLFCCSSFPLPAGAVARPAEPLPELRLTVSKDSLFYSGGEEAKFRASLENPSDRAVEGLDLLFKLYRPCRTREELAEVREGKSRYIHNALYVKKGMRSEPGTAEIAFDLDLAGTGVSEGAWPFRLEALRGDEKVAETRGYVVVSKLQSGLPLVLVPLWDVHYPPARDAQGGELDPSLIESCASDASSRGFLFSLLRAMDSHPGVRSGLALPGLNAEQIGSSAGGEGGEGAAGATAAVAGLLKSLWEGKRVELLSSTYAYADLALLIEEGWEEDAREQALRGGNALAVLLQGRAPGGLFPPRFSMHPELPGLLADEGAAYTLTTETYLAAAGDKRALAEARSGFPLWLSSGGEIALEAMVVDAPLYAVLEGWDGDRDPGGRVVLDDILAETYVLQNAKPDEKRLCLLAFPDTFRPDAEVIDRLFDELELMPWVRTETPETALSAVRPREGRPVGIGRVEESAPPYFAELRGVRERILGYRQALLDDNPLKESLYRDLLAAQGSDLYDDHREGVGERFLRSLSDRLQAELDGIRVVEQGSVTLSSTQGELTVVVSNLNPYPVRAELSLSSRGVVFPRGERVEVLLEPQENRIGVPVITTGKGGFLVDIELRCGGLKVSGSLVNLRTSNINTLSVVFLVIVVALLLLAAALKRMRHWGRRGRHERV